MTEQYRRPLLLVAHPAVEEAGLGITNKVIKLIVIHQEIRMVDDHIVLLLDVLGKLRVWLDDRRAIQTQKRLVSRLVVLADWLAIDAAKLKFAT